MIIEKAGDTDTGAIRAFLAANFFLDDADDLEAGASLLEHGIMDSTGVLEVVGFIEHTFGITVEDSEILPSNLDSIQAIAQFVTRKKNGQSTSER